MALIEAINYDPAVAVAKSTGALLPMTAFDTTNLRLQFTAPDSGNVLVRLVAVESGASNVPQVLLGVLDGATVVARAMPPHLGYRSTSNYTERLEVTFTVTGLTPGATYTWDAAYSVDVTSTGGNIRYGGPNDSTTTNAYGAFIFEVWEA